MVVDAPQPGHAHTTAELMQDAHAGRLALAAQTAEFSPRPLLRQQLDQQVHRMHRRKQTQQMDPVKLGGTALPPPSSRGARRPAFVDEIIGHERAQQFKQGHRAGRRKIGVHARQPILGNLTGQREWPNL